MSLEHFPRNKAIVIGRLYRQRDDQRTSKNRRETNPVGGRLNSYELQTVTPYGEPYALPLTIASGRVSQSVGQVHGGARVMVSGEVRLQRRIDVRFAARPTDATNRGLDVRECVMDVSAIELIADDQVGIADGSAVWLEGVVAEPPYISRHPHRPGLIYEATTLRITLLRPSPIPGSRAVVTEEVRVTVAMPTDHPDAGLVRRAGNLVRVEGQLDCVMEVRRGHEVTAAVAALDAEYAARAAQLVDDEGALLALRRTYRGRMRGLLDTPQLRVVVASIEGLDGAAPLGRRVARAERAAYAQRRDGRRASIVQQRAQRAQQIAEVQPGRAQPDGAQAAAPVEEQYPAMSATSDAPGENALPLRVTRRRRNVREQLTVKDPALLAQVAAALEAVIVEMPQPHATSDHDAPTAPPREDETSVVER
jgi:hypothetical protein